MKTLAARREGNRREMPILSREKRIRYATVGLIPQEGKRQDRGVELFCRNPKGEGEVKRKREKDTRSSRTPRSRRMRQRRGWRQVGNRTESRRLEVGGSGAEISFYGRVTNLRTRHCRVPADGRTMRLRNTMLHSGNLKAVLTTNLQPPILPPMCPSAPPPSPISQYSLLRHIPIHPIADRTIPIHRRYFLILLLLSFAPSRKFPFAAASSAVRRQSTILQVHVRKSTSLADDVCFREARKD